MLQFLTVGLGKLFKTRNTRRGAQNTTQADAPAGETAVAENGGGGAGADEREMGFFEHLEELRSMLIRCIFSFVLAMAGAFYFSKEILAYMRRPLREALASSPAAKAALESAAAKSADISDGADPVQFVSTLAGLLLNGEIPENAAGTGAAPVGLDALENAVTSAAAVAAGQTTTTLKFMDIFSVLLNIGVVGGIALSSAPILYFASRFVAPALTPAEKRCVVPFCLSAMLLFFAGCAFSFFWLTPVSIKVMFHFIHMFGMSMIWIASDYYGFVTMMTLLVGVTFQFPLVIIILQYLEIIRAKTLFSHWRHILVGILVGSLIITPLGDPVSLSMFTAVLFTLYLGATFIGAALTRGKIKKREQEEAEYERQFGHRPKRDDDGAAGDDGDDDYGAHTDDYSGVDTYDDSYNPESEDGYNYEDDYGSGEDDGSATGDDTGGGEDTFGDGDTATDGVPETTSEDGVSAANPDFTGGEDDGDALAKSRSENIAKDGIANASDRVAGTAAAVASKPPLAKGELELVE